MNYDVALPDEIFSEKFIGYIHDVNSSIEIMFGGAGCYPHDTEFMTPYGWKRISEYEHGDLVLQSTEDRETSFVDPLGYVKKPVDQFYTIKNRGCDFTTSKEHRHLVQTYKGVSRTPTTSDLLKGQSNVRGTKMYFHSTFSYSGSGVDYSDNYIRLKIAVIADGHFPKGNYTECYFNVKKPRKVKRIKELLDVNGVKYTHNKGAEGYTRIHFNMDNREKEFENYWYSATKEQIDVITEEVLLWDGSNTARSDRVSNLMSFSSTSKKSADFVQFAFSAIGVKATITEDRRDGKYRGGVCYNVGLSRKHNRIGIAKDPRHESTTTMKEVCSQDGMMYCFTVPTGFFVVRQNGRIYVSGNSGKTVHSAMKDVIRVLKGKNVLVLRQVYGTLEDSYYTDIKKAITALGFDDFFRAKKSPLRFECDNGKVILFRGLDDVEKIKGITVPDGVLNHFTIEEITETREDSLNQLQFRTRGGGTRLTIEERQAMRDGMSSTNSLEDLRNKKLKKSIFELLGFDSRDDFVEQEKTMTGLFNPVNKGHWVYDRFFTDSKGNQVFEIGDDVYNTPELYIMHSTHWDNAFLSWDDHERYESYKYINQYFYNVYCLGLWGVLGDLIFTKVKPARFSKEFIREIPQQYVGLDFGSVDPNAIMRLGVNEDKKEIYVLDEMVQNRLNTEQLVEMVRGFIDPNETVWCDSAGLQQITDLKIFGVDARSVSKYGGANFKPHGIGVLWGYTIYFSEHCKNFAREITQYSWQEDSKGNKLNKPQDGEDHTIDAGLFYALNSMLIRKKASKVYGG